jgi:zinc protease
MRALLSAAGPRLRRGTTLGALALLAAAAPGVAPLAAQQPVVSLSGRRAQPEAPLKVASVEGLTEYRLANGLRVLLFPDPSKPTITVNITYMVGSRHEGYGETGMAHLLEHLLFKGSPKHEKIDQEFTARGARWNGTTWFDRTNYFELLPASDSALDWALDLEADRMVNSFVARKDLESEMTVVRNEFESGENSPFNVLLERMLATAYLWHNYGQTTIGARSDIENVPIERLQAFYRKYYQPDNAILVVAGKIDEKATLDLVQRKFGGIPRPQRAIDRGNMLFATYTREPTQDGERTVTLRRVGDTQIAASLYHVPAAAHPDYPAVEVLASILGNEPSGRLYQALVVPKLASSITTFGQPLREPGFLMAFAQVRDSTPLEPARDVLVKTVEELAANAPTAEEVERAKIAYARNVDLALNDPERIGLELTEWAAAGDWRLMFYVRDRVAEVTPADVQRVAAAYFKPSNRTLGLFVPTRQPDRAEIAEAPDVQGLLKNYTGRAVVAAGEAFDPSPENLDRRATRTVLPNGFELALLPKKSRGQNVQLSLVLRHGTEQTLTGRTTDASFMNALLMRGTTSKSRQQVRDEFDRLKTQVNIGGASNNISVSLQTTRPNLMPALALLREVLREPAFDAKEFELLRQERLASIEEQRSEPTVLASLEFSRHLNPYPEGHPLYVETLDEEIAQLQAATPEGAARFYREFVGASRGTLAVVGDFDSTEVARFAAETFGSWNNPQPFTRMPYAFNYVAPEARAIETPDKENSLIQIGMNVPIQDTDADWPALYVANYIFGGSGLDARIAERIRQREGISYGVGSNVTARPFDRSGVFSVYAIYAPQNAERLEAAFKEELEKARRDGFTAAELAKAKSGIVQRRQQSRAQDAVVASSLQNQLYTDRTFAFDADFERKVEALTLADVNAAFRKYVDPAKLTYVKAGDFAKKAAAPKIPVP